MPESNTIAESLSDSAWLGMQPLRDLLDRIRWDAEFGKGQFALGYYDRVTHEEVIVPFASIKVTARGESFSFEGDEGVAHIPLHRVHTVYKDGAVIWQRPRRNDESVPR